MFPSPQRTGSGVRCRNETRLLRDGRRHCTACTRRWKSALPQQVWVFCNTELYSTMRTDCMTLTMPCQAFGWHCPSPPACAWLCRTAPHSGKASIPLRLIRVSEIHVGDRLSRHGNEVNLLPAGRKHVNPARHRSVLSGEIGSVPPGRDVEVAQAVQTGTVASAAGAKIVNHPPASNRPIRFQLVGVNLARAFGRVIVVHHVQSLLIGGHSEAVGPLDIINDSRQGAVRVNAIDRISVLLEVRAVEVARIGEVDTALRVYIKVVGTV